ncbi:MAG: endolytic transglycosylase MltG [Clostridia bacterium]|nr:endolytic transglycosylase MltG [Clostridia bacterium]
MAGIFKDRRAGGDRWRYTQRTLRHDREYGFYWYSWLWRIFRPLLVCLCAVIVVVGLVYSGWQALDSQLFAAPDPADATVVDFEITSGQSITSIGESLFNAGLVKNKGVFKYIVQFMGVGSKIQYGSYPLSRDMTVNDIVEKLTEGSAANERTITVIPGWTITDIADYLVANNALDDKDEFLTLADDAERFINYSYALERAVETDDFDSRDYALEGYLAPDTYRVYMNASAESIIQTLLRQTDTVIDALFNQADTGDVLLDENGNEIEDEEETDEVEFVTTLDEDQTIILASIIEKEAGKLDDYAKVSAVFHNRLERGIRLESDATVSYPLGIKRMILTAEELSSDTPYNTYTRDGLPAGPICNPSRAAIEAALHPDTDYIYEGYLYFCAGDPEQGETVFARTAEEHAANVAQYRPLWQAYDSGQ